ncbi:hypothetical protein F4604DRAFT_2015519 [Suillus subluteus]|nr:hypothetical protein F4604DRAFT_2015519 [Suillus subluteus]
MAPMVTPKLRVFTHEGRIFMSLNASFLPATIPPIPRPWNPALESDSSPDNIKDALTTQWAYETCPWFPLIATSPDFSGAVFACLNHSLYSLPIESTPDGRYMLRGDVRREWESLEQKLLWCSQQLAVNMHFPWYGQAPRPPKDYGYLRSHANARLAKKVALRSRDAFLGISALCTYFIMARQYRPHNDSASWTSLLTNDPRCPILSAWVMELSRTFVGDLTDAVPRNGMIINGAYSLAWDTDVIMFEHYKVPIWVHWPPGVSGNRIWKLYCPSADDLARATSATSSELQNNDAWGIQSDSHSWLAQPNDICDPESSQPAPLSTQPQQDLSHFPLPHKNSGQRHGEDWQAFFARKTLQNAKKEEKETPSERQARLSCQRSAENHSLPGKSSRIWVFEWQPQDDYNDFMLRTHITKARVEEVWGDYNKFTRVFDSFSNQWDLCLALDPTSIPDGDDREDDDDIMPPLPIASPSEVPPPPPSSFANDIYTYFGSSVSLSSRHTHIEGFVPVLHYYFGYRSTAPTSAPTISFLPANEWIKMAKWDQLRKLLGDSSAEMGSITEPQRQCITKFIACFVNMKESDLNTIPPDLWDLGPLPSLQISHPYIRISRVQLSQCRYYIIEPRESPNLVFWTLAVLNPVTAVMCLRRDWGSDMRQISLALLQRGIGFRTLQNMSVAPHYRRPLSELCTYTLGHRRPPFNPLYADYIIYEQLRHEFMNRPRARAAFLHDGISTEAVPFGELLIGDGDQTYYDDGLSEEEIDFMCGTYYIDHRDGPEIVSWWPQPNAWNTSGLNVGFWSACCEDWFQGRLGNLREGVSRMRHSLTKDANGPMTSTQWKRSLKFQPATNKIMCNVSAASYDFMTRASTWTQT